MSWIVHIDGAGVQIWEIPQTLGFLLDQSQLQPPEGLAKQEGIGSAEQHIDPWMLAGGIGLLGAVTVVGWRSWRGWALFCSLFPFAVALRGMGMVDEMQPRILTHWMPGLAVLLGLGFTAVMRLPGPQGWIERYWRAPRWRLDWGTCAISVFWDVAVIVRRHFQWMVPLGRVAHAVGSR